jgi:serine/threonine-protein kinase RsbW
MTTHTFKGRLENLPKIGAFVAQSAKQAGLNDSDIYAVELAVDEACTNILEHAYKCKGGKIVCTCEATPLGFRIVLKDSGPPFKPQGVRQPDFSVPLENLRIGGVGMYLIRKLMDDVRFEFRPNEGNVLTMVKRKSD